MFIRTRVINGREYQSREWRWREGGKVRSRSEAIKKGWKGGHEERIELGELSAQRHMEVAKKEAPSKDEAKVGGTMPAEAEPPSSVAASSETSGQ